MRSVSYTVLMLALVALCQRDAHAAPARSAGTSTRAKAGECIIQPEVRWLIYAYMAADNDLFAEATRDFDAMSEALDGRGSVAVLVFLDGKGSAKDGYYKLQRGVPLARAQKCKETGELRSSPEALREFLNWWQDKLPGATASTLLMWSHASGFYLGKDEVERLLATLTSISGNQIGRVRTALKELQLNDGEIEALERKLLKLKISDSGVLRLIGELRRQASELETRIKIGTTLNPPDASDGNSRPRANSEFAQVLRDHELEVLAFDACFLGTIEAAYEFRAKADVMVASADVTANWPLKAIISRLQKKPSSSADELARVMVEEARAQANVGARTLTAVKLDQVEALARSLGALARLLSREPGPACTLRCGLPSAASQYFQIVDIGTLLRAVRRTSDYSDEIVAQARATETLNQAVGIAHYHDPMHAETTGLAIYFPMNGARFYADPYLDDDNDRNTPGDYTRPRNPPSTMSFVTDIEWADFVSLYAAYTSGTRTRWPLLPPRPAVHD